MKGKPKFGCCFYLLKSLKLFNLFGWESLLLNINRHEKSVCPSFRAELGQVRLEFPHQWEDEDGGFIYFSCSTRNLVRFFPTDFDELWPLVFSDSCHDEMVKKKRPSHPLFPFLVYPTYHIWITYPLNNFFKYDSKYDTWKYIIHPYFYVSKKCPQKISPKTRGGFPFCKAHGEARRTTACCQTFVVRNSWGTSWGDGGGGQLRLMAEIRRICTSWGNGSWNSHYLPRFQHHPNGGSLGFLNHQQYENGNGIITQDGLWEFACKLGVCSRFEKWCIYIYM